MSSYCAIDLTLIITVASSRPMFSSSSSAFPSVAAAPLVLGAPKEDVEAPKVNGLGALDEEAAGAAPNVKPPVAGAVVDAGFKVGAAPNENPLEGLDPAGAAPKVKPEGASSAGTADLEAEAPNEKPPVEAAAGFAAASAPAEFLLTGDVDGLEVVAPKEKPLVGSVAGALALVAVSAPSEKLPVDDAADLAAPKEKPVDAVEADVAGFAKTEAPNENPVEAGGAALVEDSVSVFFADPKDAGAGFETAAPFVLAAGAGAGARLVPPMGTGLVDANLVAIVPACLR